MNFHVKLENHITFFVSDHSTNSRLLLLHVNSYYLLALWFYDILSNDFLTNIHDHVALGGHLLSGLKSGRGRLRNLSSGRL